MARWRRLVTIKVPLTIATFGEPADTARKVQAVPAKSGYTAAAVGFQRLLLGYNVFGQTPWALRQQA
ncbi:hypothetical protein [Mycobacterium haemophilum]|uniref:hypothetical protein n=1 Tax=Mycobacterium haemophilum TaxID=29311 RepID=UPI0012E3B5FC|nr:hypothetical protein [Mycobacterium haemophilum]